MLCRSLKCFHAATEQQSLKVRAQCILVAYFLFGQNILRFDSDELLGVAGFFDYHVCKFSEQFVNGLGLGVSLNVLTHNMSMTLGGPAYQKVNDVIDTGGPPT